MQFELQTRALVTAPDVEAIDTFVNRQEAIPGYAAEFASALARTFVQRFRKCDIVAKSACANPGCSISAPGAALKACAQCRSVAYCSTTCQLAHWKAPIDGHRARCKQAVAADGTRIKLGKKDRVTASVLAKAIEVNMPVIRCDFLRSHFVHTAYGVKRTSPAAPGPAQGPAQVLFVCKRSAPCLVHMLTVPDALDWLDVREQRKDTQLAESSLHTERTQVQAVRAHLRTYDAAWPSCVDGSGPQTILPAITVPVLATTWTPQALPVAVFDQDCVDMYTLQGAALVEFIAQLSPGAHGVCEEFAAQVSIA